MVGRWATLAVSVLLVATAAVACGSGSGESADGTSVASPEQSMAASTTRKDTTTTAVATSPSTSVGGSIGSRPGLTTTTLGAEALAFVARVDAATTCAELKQVSIDIAVAFRDTGFNPDLVAITLNEKREAIGCVPAVSLDPADPEGTIAVIGTLTDCLQILAVQQEALTLSLDGFNQQDPATFELYDRFTTTAAAQFEAHCQG